MRCRGWTLIEALAALFVGSIVLAMAIPYFHDIVVGNRLVAETNQLVRGLHAARQLAIARNQPVAFCAGQTGVGCTGDWSQGNWYVFVDANHDGQPAAGEVISMSEPLPDDGSGMTVLGNGPFRKALVFMPSGMAERISGAFGAGRLRVCSDVEIADSARDLIVSATGRVRLQRQDFDGHCPKP